MARKSSGFAPESSPNRRFPTLTPVKFTLIQQRQIFKFYLQLLATIMIINYHLVNLDIAFFIFLFLSN